MSLGRMIQQTPSSMCLSGYQPVAQWLRCSRPASHAQQCAKFICLFLIGGGFGNEFHFVVVASAMAHNATGANRIAGIRLGEFDEDFASGVQFDPGKIQHSAFADVVGAATRDAGAGIAGNDEPYGQIEPVSLPAPEDRSSRTNPGSLSCHASNHNGSPWLDESYRSVRRRFAPSRVASVMKFRNPQQPTAQL